MELTDNHGDMLAMRGIDYGTAVKLGLHTVQRGGTDWLAIPYVEGGQVVRHKYRTLGPDKQFSQDAGAKQTAWNVDCLSDDTLADEPVIITEGEFDAISAIQAGFPRSISVPGGAPAEPTANPHEAARYEWLRELMKDRLSLHRAKRIILAVDNDSPGRCLFADLVALLGRARCQHVTYPVNRATGKRLKDLNEVAELYGDKGVRETLNRADYVSTGGLFRLSALPPVGEPVSYRAQFPGLNVNLRCGDLSVTTGYPNLGKSTFVNDLICGIVMRYQVGAMFASFEQMPQRDHLRNLRRWYWQKGEALQSPVEREEADAWVDKRFAFVVGNDTEDCTLEWMLERMEAAALQYGCKLFVLDPWNEIEHRRNYDETQTEYVGRAIRALKRFARAFDVHVMIVAHPAKVARDKNGERPMPNLYDIADSAHFNNKPDLGFVVHAEKSDSDIRKIAVVKSRYREDIGDLQMIEMKFERNSGRFVPCLVPGF